MSAVFADTFFFLAILNPSDPAHAETSELSRSLRRPRITTAWVLTEVGDALARDNRTAFLDLLKLLRDNPLIRVIGPSRELFDAGVTFYGQRMDKDWPLTDCISFVVMEREGITEALTGDRHFEQAGFVRLLQAF
jgi:predicted nucleic acid-binding protein